MTKKWWILLVILVAIISFLVGIFVDSHVPSSPRIIVQDNFDGAISNWYCNGDNGGNVLRDSALYMSPNSSMKILTSIGEDKLYYAERGVSRPAFDRLGLEFWWEINSYAKSFEVSINWYYFENNAIKKYCASILYDVAETNWKYLGFDGYYYSITNGIQRLPIAETAMWIHSKLVVDFKKCEYVEFRSADKTFNLDGIKLLSLETFGNERIDWRFSVWNRDNTYSATANIDDVKVTEER